MQQIKISNEWILILGLAFIKLLIHFLTNTNYELQRDAFLYLAQADHLTFGFSSIPPLTPFLAKISQLFFGDSVFAIRLLPALIGAASILLIGKIVLDLGGKWWAVLIACLTFLVSPAFLRSNTLLQPVSFNQFFWLISTYIILKLILSRDTKYWIHLGITWGLAFLNKYSIVFLALAFLLALLITPDRKLIKSKNFFWGALIGFLIIFPNLIWQYNHNWPVLHHMAELQRNQLANVTIIGFFLMQFLMNMHGIIIWIFGLVYLLFLKDGKNMRVLGYTFLTVLLILIILRGKPYYTLGIYPILFAVGGYAIEKYWTGKLNFLKYLTIFLMITNVAPVIPYALPVLSFDEMARYAQKTKRFGLEETLRWEDGRLHALPQDYADMTGWRELSDIVIKAYRDLSDQEKDSCAIYTENYGEAGSIRYFTKNLNMPDPISFSDSFLFWAPDSINITTFIYVNDDTTEMSYYFEDIQLAGRITDPYARESGMPVFVCKKERNEFNDFYNAKVKELKNRMRN